MRQNITLKAIFICVFYLVSCSPMIKPGVHSLSEINWGNLQVTPPSNGTLCVAAENLSWDQVKQDFTYGLLGSLYPNDISETREIGNGTFSMDADKPLNFSLRLWYPEGNDRSLSMRMFALLDEEQLNDIFVHGEPQNNIILDRGSDTSIPLKVPPLSVGVHDLIVVAVPYPEDYPNPEGIVNLIYWRITIIADSWTSPFRGIDFVSLPADGTLSKKDPLLYLELTLKKDELIVWNWPNPWLDIHADEPLEFFMLAGHNYVDNLDAVYLDELQVSFFTVLLFIDYQQIEIAPNQIAAYAKVDKDTAYARIPVEIGSLPVGKHQLLALRIDSPGAPMCVLKGDPRGRILPNSIYGKLVGINVLPPK